MNAKKEEINLCDITDDGWHEDIDGYHCVYCENTDYDAEKNMIDIECVLQRESDGKLFKFTYTQYNYNGSSLQDETMVECIAKTKTVTYYE